VSIQTDDCGGQAIVNQPHEANRLVFIGRRCVADGQRQIEWPKGEVNMGDSGRFYNVLIRRVVMMVIVANTGMVALTGMIERTLILMIVRYISIHMRVALTGWHEAAKQHRCRKQ
jgi:hypothetical protein